MSPVAATPTLDALLQAVFSGREGGDFFYTLINFRKLHDPRPSRFPDNEAHVLLHRGPFPVRQEPTIDVHASPHHLHVYGYERPEFSVENRLGSYRYAHLALIGAPDQKNMNLRFSEHGVRAPSRYEFLIGGMSKMPLHTQYVDTPWLERWLAPYLQSRNRLSAHQGEYRERLERAHQRVGQQLAHALLANVYARVSDPFRSSFRPIEKGEVERAHKELIVLI